MPYILYRSTDGQSHYYTDVAEGYEEDAIRSIKKIGYEHVETRWENHPPGLGWYHIKEERLAREATK